MLVIDLLSRVPIYEQIKPDHGIDCGRCSQAE